VIITTTNDTTKLPDSFLRPSRLDLKIEIPMPNEIIRKEFFEFKGVPKNDIDFLAKETENCSLADLKEIYTTIYVLDYSLSEAIEKVKMPRTRKNYNFGKGKKSDISI
jgi:ATP-dependent 26S proteasome regulatory subunit